MRKLTIAFLCLALISCEEEVKVPDYVLKQEKFVEVMTDFQTAEAIIRLGLNRTKDSLTLNDSIYNAVFRKHNISKAVFDSNFTYYTNRPEEFQKIHEEVLEILSEKSAKTKGKEEILPENPVQ